MASFFNVSYKRVGGIRFLRIGRLSFTFSLANEYKRVALKPLPGTFQPAMSAAAAQAYFAAQERNFAAMTRNDW